MRTRSFLHLLLLSTAWLVPVARAPGDEPPDEKARSAEVAALARREAESYRLARVDDDVEVSLLPESVFQWTNPVIGIAHGRLHLWTAGGRPEAIIGVFKWYQPYKHRTNEFQSLSTGRLVATRDGREAWSPRRPGVEFRPVPGAPEPAPSPAARLRQMRDLAKEFSGRETTRDGIVRELRLLTQPIYRYAGASVDVIDGSLFVLAQGTDPEAFLMIEARKGDGAIRWQYALARMNGVAVRVEHKGREVWSLPKLDPGTIDDRHEPYTTYRFDFETR
jgi:hypothetical protein